MADATSFNDIWTFARDCVRRAAVGGRGRPAGSDTSSGCHGYNNHSAPRDIFVPVTGYWFKLRETCHSLFIRYAGGTYFPRMTPEIGPHPSDGCSETTSHGRTQQHSRRKRLWWAESNDEAACRSYETQRLVPISPGLVFECFCPGEDPGAMTQIVLVRVSLGWKATRTDGAKVGKDVNS